MSLRSDFRDRSKEIIEFLNFLRFVDKQLSRNTKTLREFCIEPLQHRTFRSVVYLLLYNLIEATVVQCTELVEVKLSNINASRFCQLNRELRREWVKNVARTHTELNRDNRLDAIIKLLDTIFDPTKMLTIRFEKPNSGSWDDIAIYEYTKRLGYEISLPLSIQREIKRTNYYNNQSCLKLVKTMRNELAHGQVSFADCGERLTVSELRKLSSVAIRYLKFVITHFERYSCEIAQ